MSEMPLISVILPTRNRAQTISRAIKSVLGQSYSNLEIIVVDDCSSDGTAEIVNGFKDSRIKYLKIDSHKGAATARNIGIQMSSGGLIAFQDSDDEWFPNKLEKQINVFKGAEERVAVVYCGCWRIFGDRKFYAPERVGKIKSGNIFDNLLFGSYVLTVSSLVKKSAVKDVGGFDEELPAYQDWDLFLRLAKKYEFLFVDEALVNAYRVKDGISFNMGNVAKALSMVMERYAEDINRVGSKLKAKHHSMLGSFLYQDGKKREGRRHIVRALSLDPLNILILLRFVLSFVLSPKRYYCLAEIKENRLDRKWQKID